MAYSFVACQLVLAPSTVTSLCPSNATAFWISVPVLFHVFWQLVERPLPSDRYYWICSSHSTSGTFSWRASFWRACYVCLRIRHIALSGGQDVAGFSACFKSPLVLRAHRSLGPQICPWMALLRMSSAFRKLLLILLSIGITWVSSSRTSRLTFGRAWE